MKYPRMDANKRAITIKQADERVYSFDTAVGTNYSVIREP